MGFLRRWPEWVGQGVRLWAVLYGVLAAYWVFGGRAGFPVADSTVTRRHDLSDRWYDASREPHPDAADSPGTRCCSE